MTTPLNRVCLIGFSGIDFYKHHASDWPIGQVHGSHQSLADVLARQVQKQLMDHYRAARSREVVNTRKLLFGAQHKAHKYGPSTACCASMCATRRGACKARRALRGVGGTCVSALVRLFQRGCEGLDVVSITKEFVTVTCTFVVHAVVRKNAIYNLKAPNNQDKKAELHGVLKFRQKLLRDVFY